MSDTHFEISQARYPTYGDVMAVRYFDQMNFTNDGGLHFSNTPPPITRLAADLEKAVYELRARLDGAERLGVGSVTAPFEQVCRDFEFLARAARQILEAATRDKERLAETERTLDEIRAVVLPERDDPYMRYRSNEPRKPLLPAVRDAVGKAAELSITRAALDNYRSQIAEMRTDGVRQLRMLDSLWTVLREEVRAGRLRRGSPARIFRRAEEEVAKLCETTTGESQGCETTVGESDG